MYHVVVPSAISRTLGQLVHNREAIVKILTRLHEELTNHAGRYQKNRDPDDPDNFIYSRGLYVGRRWCRFDFRVNDVQAQGYLFVRSDSRG
jgi:hypothetical protein